MMEENPGLVLCKELLAELIRDINKHAFQEFRRRTRGVHDPVERSKIHYEVVRSAEEASRPYRDKLVEFISLTPPGPIIIRRDASTEQLLHTDTSSKR
jgi:hypothetical protein